MDDQLGPDSTIRIDAGGWGLTLVVDDTGVLRQAGLGPDGHLVDVEVEPRWYPQALPTYGDGDPFLPAPLRVTHHDGTLSTRLVARSVRRDRDDSGESIVVTLADEELGLTVELCWRTDPGTGVLEQHLELINGEPGPVVLHDYDSMCPLLLVAEDAEVVHFTGGGWADEWHWGTHGINPGTTSFASLGGAQPHLQSSPVAMLAPNGRAGETLGDVIGVSVAWGGSTRIDLDVRAASRPGAPRPTRLRAGANPYGAQYVLDPAGRFVTPAVAWTWSTGRQELTRRFHAWTRSRVVRDPGLTRPIVSNNWEATYFDFDQARIVDLISRSADVGAELFLLDDGWFGTNHPRDDDTTSLGDWDADPAKLPAGLAPLVKAAEDVGIRFGIWVEPEMVNPVSDLHARHPEWVLRDRREPRLHRNQLLLDTLRPEVREFAAQVVDRALAHDPGISYVKWDANRPITDPGSAALPPERQANVWVDHVNATWALMDEVVKRHPEVLMMLCASGGGRTDHGTLRRFHEFWTSDNTDPVARVRMQWACSHFFPASTMAAHATRCGDKPLDFACAVALSGRFGFDLDLGSLTDDELDVCQRASAWARRTQPLVQHGELVRLVSPVEGDDRSRAAMAFLAPDRRSAAVVAYQLEPSASAAPRLVVPSLAGDETYEVVSTDLGSEPQTHRPLSGADLATRGLEWPLSQEHTACWWELRTSR